MPTTFVILVEPKSDRRIEWIGAALHAVFLRMVADRDPGAAARLHDVSGSKPYALSPLDREPGGQLVWEWSALDGDTASVMREALRALPTLVSPAGHALGMVRFSERTATYEALLDAAGRSKERTFRLSFTSPTAFKHHGTVLPLPVPRLLIKSWLDRWNTHAPCALPLDLAESAERHLTISEASLRTETVAATRIRFTGFKGQVVIHLSSDAPMDVAIGCRALIRFAEWSSTGAKTSFGFGRTRPEGRTLVIPAHQSQDRLPAPPPIVPLP